MKAHIKRLLLLLANAISQTLIKVFFVFGLHKLLSIRNFFRIALWRQRLGRIGENTMIYPNVIIHSPQYVFMGANVSIAEFVHMWGGGRIFIGDNVMIASHVAITSQTHDVAPSRRRENVCAAIVIEDNVWIGSHAVVLPGVHIGKDAVIAAGSIVIADVVSGTVVGGVPAKLLGYVNAWPAASTPSK
jgi:acetyltransferase-like isoleucine patch superfamily enzyme